MDEINDAIRRVREHGNALKAGAPHQTAIGEDMLLVCEAAAHPAMVVPPSPLIEQLHAKLAQASAALAQASAAHDALIADHDRLMSEKVDLETRLAASPAMDPNTGYLKGPHPLAQFATDADRSHGQDIDPANPPKPGAEPSIEQFDAALTEAITKADARANLLGDKQLTKAERKAQNRAHTDASKKA